MGTMPGSCGGGWRMAFMENPELEAAIEKNPSDADVWLVYADWLQSVGDPRGELMSLALQLELEPGADETMLRQRFAELAAEVRPELLGSLGEVYRGSEAADDYGKVLFIDWWHGAFIASLKVRFSYGNEDFDAQAALETLL